MPANLEFFEADGATPSTAPNWGKVRPGRSGETIVRVMRNTGDTAAEDVVLGMSQIGAVDLESWVTVKVGTQTFTAMEPLNVANLAPGESLTLTLNLAVPSGALLSNTPAVALLYADCDS